MEPFDLGDASVRLWRAKMADAPVLSYGMKGRLVVSKSGWVLLEVPNAIGNGAFQALHETDIEQPARDSGRYNAHVSIMRKEELEEIGGESALKERGQLFGFTLGAVRHIKNPNGWNEIKDCWVIDIKSPELMKLRRSYGLGEPKYKFHLTFAVRKRKTRKQASIIHFGKQAATNTAIRESSIDGKGLFATSPFADGDIILERLMTKAPSKDSRTRWEQSEDARYTNHSNDPNVEVVRNGDYVQLRALRDIVVDEELTTDYAKASAALGPGFYYTYKGKDYGGESSTGNKSDFEKSDTLSFAIKNANSSWYFNSIFGDSSTNNPGPAVRNEHGSGDPVRRILGTDLFAHTKLATLIKSRLQSR